LHTFDFKVETCARSRQVTCGADVQQIGLSPTPRQALAAELVPVAGPAGDRASAPEAERFREEFGAQGRAT
jgi:hypothetical protein